MSRNRATSGQTRIGALLASLRTRSKLSTRDIAKRGELSLDICYRVERGTVKDPQAAIAFAQACGATPPELQRLRVLLARDRGVIDVPSGATDEQIIQALRALGG